MFHKIWYTYSDIFWYITLCVPNSKIDPLFRPPIKHAFCYSILYSVSKNRPENSIYRYDFACFKKFSIELFSSIFCNLPPLFSAMLKYWVTGELEFQLSINWSLIKINKTLRSTFVSFVCQTLKKSRNLWWRKKKDWIPVHIIMCD